MSGHGLVSTVIGGGSSYTPELLDGLIARRDTLPRCALASSVRRPPAPAA